MVWVIFCHGFANPTTPQLTPTSKTTISSGEFELQVLHFHEKNPGCVTPGNEHGGLVTKLFFDLHNLFEKTETLSMFIILGGRKLTKLL